MRKITVQNYRDDKYYPRVVSAVSRILDRQDFVSPVELFTEMMLLQSEDVESWRRGQISYLERVIQCNLTKASRILRILRFHAHGLNLGPSMTVYKRRSKTLRFSKTGENSLEEAYSRHFVIVGKKRSKRAVTSASAPEEKRIGQKR